MKPGYDWTLIATWRIPRNVVFGDHVIGFFSTRPGEDEKLAREISDYPLPEGVTLRMRPPRGDMKDGC